MTASDLAERLREMIGKAEAAFAAAAYCPTCGDPWALRLCARCTPPDDSAARLAQEVEYLRAELAALRARIAAADGPVWLCDGMDRIVAWVGSEASDDRTFVGKAGILRCACCHERPRRVLILDDPETKPEPPACGAAPVAKEGGNEGGNE